MNLKDAIREAVDARDKPEPNSEAQKEAVPEVSSQDVQASNKAVKQASSKAVKQASSKAVKQDAEPVVQTAAMTIRVSRRHRLHWLIAAKKEGTSLTAAITEALNARFGEPSD